MNPITGRTYDRVPRWARTELEARAAEIARLERIVAERDATIASLAPDAPESTGVVIVDNLARHDRKPERRLPEYTEIRFELPPIYGHPRGSSIEVRHTEGRTMIELRSPEGTLRIQPSSSNLVQVWAEPTRFPGER